MSDSSGAPLLVWDCGSALYDSYELTAFKRQLDATVLACGRSLSMPHLSAGAGVAGAHQHHQQPAGGRRKRRLPALFRRLFSKVIRLRLFTAVARARAARYGTGGDYSGGAGSPWSGSGALTSIPEEEQSPEKGSSPVVDHGPSALRKAQSERFIGSKTASSMVQFEPIRPRSQRVRTEMASQEKPTTPPPPPPQPPAPEGGVARARGPVSGGAHAGGSGYPHPPDAAIPDAATLRDQWRFAVRQYSRWYSHAWGTAILAGGAFFALGWLVKGSNPLPSRAEPHADADTKGNAVAAESEECVYCFIAWKIRGELKCVEQFQMVSIPALLVPHCLVELLSLNPPHDIILFSITGFPRFEWQCPVADVMNWKTSLSDLRKEYSKVVSVRFLFWQEWQPITVSFSSFDKKGCPDKRDCEVVRREVPSSGSEHLVVVDLEMDEAGKAWPMITVIHT
ncbi:hypothetical protein EJB05_42382, partial [Eragrostis curvula]